MEFSGPVGGGYPKLLPSMHPRHPLLEKGIFEQLHRNEIVETRPHTLHFGGFKIHKEHTQILRILNISPSSLRVSIIGPSTQWFKVNFDKKGFLAPGMSEDISVSFTPHDWRYYYDTIKVFCGDLSENLVVPIHAYPSANDIELPRVVEFGKVAVGTPKSKTIPLSCKIPLQFEFEITILEAHPDIEIYPCSGVIPADGKKDIVIKFTPTRHRTARAELQFNIAQFDFDPVAVTVVGSSAPDVTREDILHSAQTELDAAQGQSRREAMAATVDKLKGKRSRGKLEVKKPTFTVEVSERVVDGFRVPVQISGVQATNFVLRQRVRKSPQLATDDRDKEFPGPEGASQEDQAGTEGDENANMGASSKMLYIVDVFVRAGSKCLIQVRAHRHCQMLRGAIRLAGVVDRESCKAWVEADNQLAATRPKSEDADKLRTVRIPTDFALPPSIPTAPSGMDAEVREPVEVRKLDNFEQFLAAQISVRLDYKVLQYERQRVPPSAAYMRLHNDQPRLRAALEEHSIRGPRGSAQDGAETPLAMPDSCLLPPSHDALSLLVPSTDCRTYVGFPEATECDPEYQLSRPPPLLAPLTTDPLLPPHLMGLDAPKLAAWRTTRQITDPFQYFDPMPPSFAEAGGSFGPRIGCDAGGERLSFLPVGGFERDLPSDTDDDECGEFQLAPPSEESYDAACRSLDAPLASDLWRTDDAAEKCMRERCAANSKAVRERLMELNQDLDYRNKLYLG